MGGEGYHRLGIPVLERAVILIVSIWMVRNLKPQEVETQKKAMKTKLCSDFLQRLQGTCALSVENADSQPEFHVTIQWNLQLTELHTCLAMIVLPGKEAFRNEPGSPV